jgi:uncharacterized protein YeaO (DUF488 family)
MDMVKLKRVYEPAAKSDGYRVLVDRLWPRGIKKEKLASVEWAKDLAPSAELRKAFGHDTGRWKEFRTQYKSELRRHKKEIAALAKRGRRGTVTLLYAARDEEHNNAVVLKELLDREMKKSALKRAA